MSEKLLLVSISYKYLYQKFNIDIQKFNCQISSHFEQRNLLCFVIRVQKSCKK